MHLRWIYVKDHALLFIALTAVSIAALVIAVLLMDDPARGLLLGITPTLFALLVWALTNRAGYAERVPETQAHQRTAPTDGEVSAWDPFELDRPVSPEPPPAPIGDGPTTTPSETTAPDAKPARPATSPKQETTGKATRRSDPNGPGQQKQKPATAGKAEAVAKRPTPSGTAKTPPVRQPKPDRRDEPKGPVVPPLPAQEKASSNPAPSESGTSATGKPGKVRHPNPSQPQARPSRQSGSPEVGPDAGKPAAPSPPGDKQRSRHNQKGRKASAGDPIVSNPPKTPPDAADTPSEHLTPAEAAKRDAEARKSRKRKGKPDEAA